MWAASRLATFLCASEIAYWETGNKIYVHGV